MIRSIIITGLLLFTVKANAQIVYEASTIPKDLLPYASAVVRKMEVTTEVKDLTNTINHFKEVVTILNKNGDHHADIGVWYNKSNRIKYIKGVVYDEFGKPVKKFTEKNFSDHSAGDDASLFVDSRLKHYNAAIVTYPYTIEYEYEELSKQTLNFNDWSPNDAKATAIEHSSFQFICKPDFNIRYKELNYNGKAITGTNATGFKTYTWEVSNVKALRSEPYSPDPEQYKTTIKIAPEKFIYEGYDGSFTNWNELGKWVHDRLLLGRATLSPETVSNMRSLTDSIKSPKMKAKAIYEYMQRKNRYVSVQIGIGGFQPILASDVDRVSYGDCKALVNYTQALLKAVNIDSYYCVVQAGDFKKSLMPDFASMAQGNHIILCLPFKNDTTWLECTSKDTPFGYLGNFTDDRWVLACTTDGGKLLHTPKYTAEQSKQIRIATATLKADGELNGSMKTTFEGWQFENRPTFPGETSDEIKKAKERYSINNLEIEALKLNMANSQQPINNEEMKFTAGDYAAVSTNGLVFMVNIANRYTSVPREVRNRITDVYINRGYTDVDEITYNVPAGYRLDSNPLQVNIDKPFGKFTATAIMNSNNQIVYKRKIQMIDGTYPKDKYQDLVDFYQQVADADNYKATLVKTN
jgi:hypothetical protein